MAWAMGATPRRTLVVFLAARLADGFAKPSVGLLARFPAGAFARRALPLVALVVACGGDPVAGTEACFRSCERMVVCAPGGGDMESCLSRCVATQARNADPCMTAAHVDTCLAMDACADFVTCTVAANGCNENAFTAVTEMPSAAVPEIQSLGMPVAQGAMAPSEALDATVLPPEDLLEDLAQRTGEIFCAGVLSCCGDGGPVETEVWETCVGSASRGYAAAYAPFLASMEAGRVRYAADRAESCLTKAYEGSCWNFLAPGPACDTAPFEGLQQQGQPCSYQDECADGGICGAAGVCLPGIERGDADATAGPGNAPTCMRDLECPVGRCVKGQCRTVEALCRAL